MNNGRTEAISLFEFFNQTHCLDAQNANMAKVALQLTQALEEAGVDAEVRWVNVIVDHNGNLIDQFAHGFFFVRNRGL